MGESIHGSGSYQGTLSACSAMLRNHSMARGTSTTDVLRSAAPAFCDSSRPQSSETSWRCSTIWNMIWVRCSCDLRRQSPASNERRAAATARRASARVLAGATAMTSSVEGLITL